MEFKQFKLLKQWFSVFIIGRECNNSDNSFLQNYNWLKSRAISISPYYNTIR